jgi:hypothetical protein
LRAACPRGSLSRLRTDGVIVMDTLLAGPCSGRHYLLTDPRQFGILQSGLGWWGPNAIRAIETTRVHHPHRRRGSRVAMCIESATGRTRAAGRCAHESGRRRLLKQIAPDMTRVAILRDPDVTSGTVLSAAKAICGGRWPRWHSIAFKYECAQERDCSLSSPAVYYARNCRINSVLRVKKLGHAIKSAGGRRRDGRDC